MPSVATIESVLRLSAPVQFRLGPASQRAECREVSVPDWLVDWLPPSAEWSRAENVCAGLAGRLAAAERRVEQSRVDWLSVPVQPFPNRPPRARECLSPISVLSRIGWSIGCHRAQSGAESVCPRLAGRLVAAELRVKQRVSVPVQLVSAVPRDCLSSISFFNQFRPGGACQDPLRTIPDQSLQVG